MTFTPVTIDAPTCAHHITVRATINGEVRVFEVNREDITADNPEEARERIIHRLRSFQLENGYNFTQLRANLAGKTLHI